MPPSHFRCLIVLLAAAKVAVCSCAAAESGNDMVVVKNDTVIIKVVEPKLASRLSRTISGDCYDQHVVFEAQNMSSESRKFEPEVKYTFADKIRSYEQTEPFVRDLWMDRRRVFSFTIVCERDAEQTVSLWAHGVDEWYVDGKLTVSPPWYAKIAFRPDGVILTYSGIVYPAAD